MDTNTPRSPIAAAPLLAMSATAHNGLEKLSIRLAELNKDHHQFSEKERDAFLTHLEAAKNSARACAELIRKMSAASIEVPPLEEEEEGGPPDPLDAYERPHLPEDDIFPTGGVSDMATGLPGRSIAGKAIQSALHVGRPRFGAVFSIDRLRYIASRYGTDAGVQSIRQYATHLRQKMPQDTMLFRWSGPCLLGLFDSYGTLGDAKSSMETISTLRVKFNFESNQRSAMLNLTSLVHVQAFGATDIIDIFRQFDTFVEMHSRKQPD